MARQDRLLRLERELHLEPAVDSTENLIRHLAGDDRLCLDVVEYLLRDLRGWQQYGEESIVGLAKMLAEANSVWEVVSWGGEREDEFTLERRISETAAAAAREAFKVPRAGDHLRKAWHATYGLSPDPSEAYLEAVQAVEAAAKPVVSPNNPKTTLGTVIDDLGKAPGKWEVVLGGLPALDQVQAVRGMGRLLWKGHTNRHGSDDPAYSIPPTQEQAEAGVHMAVLLVQWFASGSLRRIRTPTRGNFS